jgi:hypothetical protein
MAKKSKWKFEGHFYSKKGCETARKHYKQINPEFETKCSSIRKPLMVAEERALYQKGYALMSNLKK